MKTQIREANGKKWIQIQSLLTGEKFHDAIRHVAKQHGVDIASPKCRVEYQGKVIWSTYRTLDRNSYLYGTPSTVNTAGYWLPVVSQ